MKIFKHRNIMGCIFGLMLSLPLLAVLARSAYVVCNKNAYQSYSDQYVEKVLTLNDSNKSSLYIQNQVITLTDVNRSYFSASSKYGFSNISLDLNNLLNTTNINYTGFKFYTSTSTFMYFYDNLDNEYRLSDYKTLYSSFTYTVDLTQYTSIYAPEVYWQATTVLYGNNSLDNVFEYSLDKVIENNNFGNINFLEWFEDMFLSDNQVNNRYVHYFNWYLNYTMFVSCAYILFLCLMWFVNFSRRLLERGMNYDW